MLLLDKRLKVETVVPDSLGLVSSSAVGDKRSGGERRGGVGAHILSALFPDDDSIGGERLLDQVRVGDLTGKLTCRRKREEKRGLEHAYICICVQGLGAQC